MILPNKIWIFVGNTKNLHVMMQIYSSKRGMDIEKRNRFSIVFCKLMKDSELGGVLLLLWSRGDK